MANTFKLKTKAAIDASLVTVYTVPTVEAAVIIGLTISNIIASIIYMHTCQKNLKLKWDFKLIIKIYLYFISTTYLIIILREWELYYSIRLIIKLCLLSIFVLYVHYNKIIDFKTYYNEIQNKINKLIILNQTKDQF